jgi:hypothetical protein
MRRALPTALALLFALVSAPGLAAAAPARYVFEKCDSVLPGGGTDGATFVGPAPFTPGNNCAEPEGALIILQGGPTNSAEAHWALPMPAPPGGTMESITVTAELCDGTNHDPETVAYAIRPAWPVDCSVKVRSFPINSAGGSSGLLSLACNGSCAQDPFAWAHYFAATEVDPVPPSIDSLRGTLVAGGTVHGSQTLTATAHDEGGGIESMSLRLNGSLVAPRKDFNCQTAKANNSSFVGTVATVVTPCPAVAQAAWALNTENFPFHDGRNTLQLCADDFSTIGPPNESCSEEGVEVDNSCPQSLTANGENLTAAFKQSDRQRITVGFGHPAKIAGRLTDANRQPLAGATVCVWARTLEGAAPKQLLQALVTDAHGHYSYLLGPGPNRAVIVGYRQDARQLERHLRYLAHAHPTLRSSAEHLRNGQWLHFRGRLPGPGRSGRVIVLQANVVGSSRWVTFRRATTDREGLFSAAYRFNSTTRTTGYRFRAVVPSQDGYPWVQGHSRSVKVTVTP